MRVSPPPKTSFSTGGSTQSEADQGKKNTKIVSVNDSPLWALNIMNGTHLRFHDITCKSTALQAPYGTNWVQNTDGFNTMDAFNVELTNFYYQGGDDCVAIKPRSYNIFIQNVSTSRNSPQ